LVLFLQPPYSLARRSWLGCESEIACDETIREIRQIGLTP
jgi:hypothetical protein